MNQKKMEWYLLSLMLLIVAIVFWQVYTDMTQAGIASGGPLDNAAAYPRALAVILGLLVAIRTLTKFFQTRKLTKEPVPVFSLSVIKKPGLLLLIFGLYLLGLKILGYHLMTSLFLFIVLYVAGERKLPQMLIFAMVSSITVAFIFEVLLKIVLPGGVFRINIPW